MQIKTSKSLLIYLLFNIFYYKKSHLDKDIWEQTIIPNVHMMMMLKQHYVFPVPLKWKFPFTSIFLNQGGWVLFNKDLKQRI